MVARINKGSSIKVSPNYNEQKCRQQVAELILAENYFKDAQQLNFREKLFMLEHQAKLNERVTANSVHISLSFHPEEKLVKEKLQDIAKRYMDQIGFGNQPYLVYQHHDAGHPHIHIVTTNFTGDGKRIDMNNIGRTLSEKARKSIDKEFKLISPESKKLNQQIKHKERLNNGYELKPVNIQKVHYGKSQTKAAIQNVVEYVINQYKFTSLGEYNAVLKLYNVVAYPGQKDSLMYQNRGLVYRVLDEAGNKIGTPIKASQFYNKPTLKNLGIKFKENEVLRVPFARRIKNTIDLSIIRNNSFEKLGTDLRKEGIEVLARQNAEGRIYGMTFVDFETKCFFNGSDLGRQYSANALQERCSPNTEISSLEQKMIDQKIKVSMNGMFAGQKDKVSDEEYTGIFQKNERLFLLENILKPRLVTNSMPTEFMEEQRHRKKKRKKQHL